MDSRYGRTAVDIAIAHFSFYYNGSMTSDLVNREKMSNMAMEFYEIAGKLTAQGVPMRRSVLHGR